MIDLGKRNVCGVLVDAIDYEAATALVLEAAEAGRPLAGTALAVHGVMAGVDDAEHRHRLNSLDLVTPDGQPVRWALNLLAGTGLADRVYGPMLTRHLLDGASARGLPVFFLGSTEEVLERLSANVARRWPALVLAGTRPSAFRPLTPQERDDAIDAVRTSGARLLFVGLGCPRQEVFCWENRDALAMPALAVGAAFDYLAGTVREPPAAVQRFGLQWLYRLGQQPGRLWRRYLVLNPRFLARLAAQRVGLWRPDPRATTPPQHELRYG